MAQLDPAVHVFLYKTQVRKLATNNFGEWCLWGCRRKKNLSFICTMLVCV